MSPTPSIEYETPYIRALCCSRNVQSCSRFSSGWRHTNASIRSACSPTISPQTVLSFLVPGRSTSQRPGAGCSCASSPSRRAWSMTASRRATTSPVPTPSSSPTPSSLPGDLGAGQGPQRSQDALAGGADRGPGQLLPRRGVGRDQGVDRAVPRELGGVPARPGGEQLPPAEQGADRGGVVDRVVAVDQDAGDAVADRRPEAADGGGDDRRPARL